MSPGFVLLLAVLGPAPSEDIARTYTGPPDVEWEEQELPTPTPAPAPEVEEPHEPAPEPETETEPESESGSKPSEKENREDVPKFLQAIRFKDSLVLGGYIQPGFVYVTDTAFNQDDQDGFDFANARLTGEGEMPVYKRLYMAFKFNFDVNQGNFGVRDVYGSIFWRDGLIGFDLGQFKQPFSVNLLQSQSKMQFSYSPATRDLAFGRDQGAQLRSEGTVGKRVWMKGAVMIANGEGGFRQRRNIDKRFQYTGRYEIAPLGKLTLSEPDLDKSDVKFVLGINAGYTPRLGKGFGVADVGASETRVGGDARLHFKGLSVRAEYIHAFRGENTSDDPTVSEDDVTSTERYGAVAQVGYILPIPIKLPRFEVVFRFQQLDVNTALDGTEGTDYVVDNTERRIYEPGLSIYLFGHAARLTMSYQLTDLTEGPRVDTNGDPLLGDAFLAFFQFAWL